MSQRNAIPKHLQIKNIKRFIANNGLFRQLENSTNTMNGHNRSDMYFLRSVVDRAILDVLSSNAKQERREAMEWFATSSFDHLCSNAGMEPGFVFKVMQGVFDNYKESPYGEKWKRPNVHPIRTSVN